MRTLVVLRRWDAEHGSENEPVSELPPDQLYWCIAMEDRWGLSCYIYMVHWIAAAGVR